MQRCAHRISPEVVVCIHTDADNIAFGGELHGPEGMVKVIRDGTAQFQDRTVESEQSQLAV